MIRSWLLLLAIPVSIGSPALSSSEVDWHGKGMTFVRDNDPNTYIYSSKVKGCRSVLFANHRNVKVVPDSHPTGTRINLTPQKMTLDTTSEEGINRLLIYDQVNKFMEKASNEAIEMKRYGTSFRKLYNCYTKEQKLKADKHFGIEPAQPVVTRSNQTYTNELKTDSCSAGKTLRLTSLGKFCLTDFEYSQILRQEREDQIKASRQRAIDRLNREKDNADFETRKLNALRDIKERERQSFRRTYESTQKLIDSINEGYNRGTYCTGSMHGNSFSTYCN